MKTPFLWIAIGLSSGMLLDPWIRLPLKWILPGLTALIFVLWKIRGRRSFLPLYLIALSLFAMSYARFGSIDPGTRIEDYSGTRVSLEGVVWTDPEIKVKGKKRTVSFVLKSKNLMRWVDERREFHETTGDVQVFLFNPVIETGPQGDLSLVYGDRVRMWGKLETPRPAMNPGQFDYGKYLAQQNIYAIFNGYGKRSVKIVGPNEGSRFRRWVEKLRRAIERRIEELYRVNNQAAIFKALMLGKRKELDPELRDQMMKTGTSHLLAISGLHIGLVSGSLFLCLLLLGFRQKPAAWILLVMTTLLVFIAGNGIPVRRAGLMAGAVFLALVLERKPNAWNTFFFALTVFLFTDPRILTKLSFQLSFLSVFSMILFVRDFHESRSGLEVFKRSFVILIGTAPLIIYYFHVFSLVSVFANAGAIPLFHLALLSSIASVAFSWIPWLGTLLTIPAGWYLELGLKWIRLWSLPSWGYVYLPAPSFVQMTVYYLLGLSAVLFRYRLKENQSRLNRLCYPGALTLWILCASTFVWPKDGPGFSMTVFSAGKNEAAYFQLDRNAHWLINTGRGRPSDQARWILGPFLKSRGVNVLSGLILTDGYQKHLGGLRTILRDFKVRYLFYPEAIEDQVNESTFKSGRLNLVSVRKSREITVGDHAEIQIHSTGEGRSLVWVSVKAGQFVLIPEWNRSVEAWIQANRQQIMHADLLVLPSGFESKLQIWERFFDWLDPQWVTIPDSTDELDVFLNDRDISVFDLSETGAVTFSLTGGGLNL